MLPPMPAIGPACFVNHARRGNYICMVVLFIYQDQRINAWYQNIVFDKPYMFVVVLELAEVVNRLIPGAASIWWSKMGKAT
jgi:hypothetical protein